MAFISPYCIQLYVLYVPRQKYSEYIGWLSLSYLSYIATANIQKEQQK